MLTPRETLKTYFKKGLKPLEAQFASWLDSFWHKEDSIPLDKIAGTETLLSDVENNKDTLTAHISDIDNPHQVNKAQLQLDNVTNDAQVKRSEMATALGVATLDELNRLVQQVDASKVVGVLSGANIPALAITKKINTAESIFATFLENNTNYTFEQGDVVVINSEPKQYYFYWGGDASVADNYSFFVTTQIDWANIVDKPNIYIKDVDDATAIKLVTTNFGKNFSASTDTLQKLADLLDDKLFGHNIQQRGVDMPEAETLNFLFNISYDPTIKTINIALDTRIEIALIGLTRLPCLISSSVAEKVTEITVLKNVYTLQLINNSTSEIINIHLNGVNQTLPISVPVADYDFLIVYDTGKSDGKICLKTVIQ